MQEIERRFLIKDGHTFDSILESVEEHDMSPIFQAYLMLEDKKQLRIRKMNVWQIGQVYTLCYKYHKNDVERDEIEIPVKYAEGEALIATTDIQLNKKRYQLYNSWPLAVKEVVLDIYPSEKGLAIIEIEYKSTDDISFVPDFCGDEVTGRKEYSNIWFAKKEARRIRRKRQHEEWESLRGIGLDKPLTEWDENK